MTYQQELDAWCTANGYEAVCDMVTCGNIEMASAGALRQIKTGARDLRGCITIKAT